MMFIYGDFKEVDCMINIVQLVEGFGEIEMCFQVIWFVFDCLF